MLFGTALAKLFNLLIANNKSFALHTTVCVLATSFFTASLWKLSHTVVAEALHIKDKQIISLNRKLFPFKTNTDKSNMMCQWTCYGYCIRLRRVVMTRSINGLSSWNLFLSRYFSATPISRYCRIWLR